MWAGRCLPFPSLTAARTQKHSQAIISTLLARPTTHELLRACVGAPLASPPTVLCRSAPTLARPRPSPLRQQCTAPPSIPPCPPFVCRHGATAAKIKRSSRRRRCVGRMTQASRGQRLQACNVRTGVRSPPPLLPFAALAAGVNLFDIAESCEGRGGKGRGMQRERARARCGGGRACPAAGPQGRANLPLRRLPSFPRPAVANPLPEPYTRRRRGPAWLVWGAPQSASWAPACGRQTAPRRPPTACPAAPAAPACSPSCAPSTFRCRGACLSHAA